MPLPASRRIDTLLLGCTHYPLLRPLLRAAVGESVAIVDSATATASTLAELLVGQRPRVARDGEARRNPDGGDRPRGRHRDHVQYTTGDVDAFRALARQLFGFTVTDVRPVELRVGAS